MTRAEGSCLTDWATQTPHRNSDSLDLGIHLEICIFDKHMVLMMLVPQQYIEKHSFLDLYMWYLLILQTQSNYTNCYENYKLTDSLSCSLVRWDIWSMWEINFSMRCRKCLLSLENYGILSKCLMSNCNWPCFSFHFASQAAFHQIDSWTIVRNSSW